MTTAPLPWYLTNVEPYPPPEANPPRSRALTAAERPQIHPVVSDPAWDRLIDLATIALYRRRDSARAHGLARYILSTFAVPDQEWDDYRPPYLIDTSLQRLNPDPSVQLERRRADRNYNMQPMVPLWWDPDMVASRTVRTFYRATLPLEAIAQLATRLGITDPHAHEFNFNPTTQLGAILEAWGRGNLRPRHEPINRHPAIYRWRKPKESLVW